MESHCVTSQALVIGVAEQTTTPWECVAGKQRMESGDVRSLVSFR